MGAPGLSLRSKSIIRNKPDTFCSPSEDQYARWATTNLTMAPDARAPGIRHMIDGGKEAAMDVQRLLLLCKGSVPLPSP